jgi:hypothetical protein
MRTHSDNPKMVAAKSSRRSVPGGVERAALTRTMLDDASSADETARVSTAPGVAVPSVYDAGTGTSDVR